MGLKKRKNGGFTMVEMLATAAILMILMAFGFVEIIKHLRYLKVIEMDNMARSIYLAAENRAVTLAKSGRLTKASLTDAGSARGTSFASDEFKDMCYVKAPGANLVDLLPMGAIDPTLRNASFYVVYDFKAGCVKDVFYDEKIDDENFKAAFSYLSCPDDFEKFYKSWSDASTDTSRKTRADKKIYIGYYGGKADAPPGSEAESEVASPIEVKPEIDIINGEELKLYVKYKRANDPSINGWKLRVDLTYGKKTVTLSLDNGEQLPGSDTWTYTLDALRGPHFKDLVWKNDDGTPMSDEKKAELEVASLGGIFTIEAWMVEKDTSSFTRANIIATHSIRREANSLFGDASGGGTAAISNLRHLQNLDEKFSGVSNITKALQVANIDASKLLDNNNNIIDADYKFKPISNSKLTSYESYADKDTGQCFSIKNLTVTNESSAGAEIAGAGLFAEMKGTSATDKFICKNVWLINVSVDGGDKPAGALAGTATNVDFTGCRVYWEETSKLQKDGKVEYKILSNSTAGGFVGTLSGGSIKDSFAATTIQGNKNIGGLAGNVSDVTIEKAYADCYIKGETGDLRAGGLIGSSSGGTKLTNVYSTGFIEWTNTTEDSRVAGFCAEGSVEAKNAYSGVYYQATGDFASKLAGGEASAFGKDIDESKRSNCYAAWGAGSDAGYEGIKNSKILSLLGSEFASKDSDKLSHPYRLGKNSGLGSYEAPGIVGLPHYGDWANGNQGGLPVVWVVNGEELQAKIKTKGNGVIDVDNAGSATPHVKLKYGDKEVSIATDKIQWAGNDVSISSTESEVLWTVTLDSLNGPHFKDLWESASSKPSSFGGDFSVLASTDGSTWTKSSASSSSNSLFAGGAVTMSDGKEIIIGDSTVTVPIGEPISISRFDTAYIENLRHLQNLDTALSGVSETKTKVVQTADIDAGVRKNNDGKGLGEDGKPVADGAEPAPYYFKPITNRNLRKYSVEVRKDATGNVIQGEYWKISNLKVKTDINAGLFAEVYSSGSDDTLVSFEFNDVTIETANVESTGKNAGALVGNANGTVVFKNCKTAGVVNVTGQSAAGGLIGNATGATGRVEFTNCKTTGAAYVTGQSAAGGLIGNVDGSAKFDNCMTDGIVNITGQSETGGAAGGLAGTASGVLDFNNCKVVGTLNQIEYFSITGPDSAGGLVGKAGGGANFIGCQVYWAKVDPYEKDKKDVKYVIKGSNAGGLAGWLGGGIILDSFAATFVSGTSNAGGLVGSVEGDVEIYRSYADCYLEGKYAGGLIGGVSKDKTAVLTNVYSAGFIKLLDNSNGVAGGLCASSSGTITAGNAYAAVHYPSSAKAEPLAPGVTHGGNNCYYVDYVNGKGTANGCSYKDMTVTSDGKITVNVGTGKKTDTVAALLGDAFASPGTPYPYNLAYEERKNAGEYPDITQYHLPMLKDTANNVMSHYGDWKVDSDVPEVRIINGDELVAVIVTKSVKEPHVRLIYGNNWVLLPAGRIEHEGDTNWINAMLGGLTVPAGGAAWRVTLDSLNGPQFKDCTGKDWDWKNLDGTPAEAPKTFGNDFRVEASYDLKNWSIDSNALANSLFASVQMQGIKDIDAAAINYANIENLRHLRNLDAAFSGVAGIGGAIQKQDIEAGVLKNYKGVVGETPYQFIPIVNDKLTRYIVDNKKDANGTAIPGQYWEIKNLRVTAASSSSSKNGAGLFGTTGNASFVFQGVTLTDASVGKTETETADISVPAGAIVGKTTGEVLFRNCTVSRGSVRSSSHAGGIAGHLDGSATVTVVGCAAINTTVQSTGGDKSVGGLLGQADAEINMEDSKSYWDTSTLPSSTLPLAKYKFTDDLSDAPLPKIEGANAGGLIGTLWNKGLITNSFAATYVMGSNNMGGLIGKAVGNASDTVNIYSCYADCYMDIARSKATCGIGGLIGMNVLNVNIHTAYVAGFFRGTNTYVQKVNGLCGNNMGSFKVTSAYNIINNVCGTNIEYEVSVGTHISYYYGTTLAQINTLVDTAFTGQTTGTVGSDGKRFTQSPSTVNPYGLAGPQGNTYPYPGLKTYVGDNQFSNEMPARPHYGDWQYVAP